MRSDSPTKAAGPAGQDVYDQIAEITDGYHPDVVECQLGVQVLFAHPGKNLAKPPLTNAGYSVPGISKWTSLEDRIGGAVDAKIILHPQAWANYSEIEQIGLLERLIYRLEVQRDQAGAIKTDDVGRPLLKLRNYDYLVCGYDCIVHRYGTGSIDSQEIEEWSLHYSTLSPINQPVAAHS
jgi:hypothetical protein